MPKKIDMLTLRKTKELATILTLFKNKRKLRYGEIRAKLGLSKYKDPEERKEKWTPEELKNKPIKHEKQLDRILKRMVHYGILSNEKDGRNSYYIYNEKNWINPALLRRIEEKWGIEPFPKKAVVEKALLEHQKWFEEGIFKGEKTARMKWREQPFPEIPYWNYGRPSFFTEEDVLWILKHSPTALSEVIEKPKYPDIGDKVFFQDTLLQGLITDFYSYGPYFFANSSLKHKISIEISMDGKKVLEKESEAEMKHYFHSYIQKQE